MNLTELNEQFGLPGVLRFEETSTGLIYAEVNTPAATATIYLQGAHLTHWQPVGERPVLFLSKKTELKPGKAIRGGVPISFPWFATDQKSDRIDGKPGPSHGFARIQEWTLAFVALSGEDLHLTFTLGATEMSRALGFDHFRTVFQVTIGRSLTMKLTAANDADEPLLFEEAFHTYFAVADVLEATLNGLEEVAYIDKNAGSAQMPAANAPLRFAEPTDRVYNHTTATCVLQDAGNHRKIRVEKTGSETTVVFNPWKEMADLGAEEWRGMLCVETANAVKSPMTLMSGEAHTMRAVITVEADS